MFRSSCKKLIIPFLLCIFLLSGCTTAGKGEKSDISPEELLPGGCSMYIGGRVDTLPAGFTDMLEENGIPSRIIKKTERIYIASDDNDRLSVLLRGDYRRISVRGILNIKNRFAESEETEHLYHDRETGSHIYVPDYFTIVFTQDKPEAILNGSFLSENRDTRFSAMFTDDIFIYSETGDFSAFTSAGKVGENYLFNSVLDFGSGRKARIFSSLIRLYVVDLINRNNLDTDIRCVSVDGDIIRISNITVPEDKLGIIFNFYRSEITGK